MEGSGLWVGYSRAAGPPCGFVYDTMSLGSVQPGVQPGAGEGADCPTERLWAERVGNRPCLLRLCAPGRSKTWEPAFLCLNTARLRPLLLRTMWGAHRWLLNSAHCRLHSLGVRGVSSHLLPSQRPQPPTPQWDRMAAGAWSPAFPHAQQVRLWGLAFLCRPLSRS